MNTEQYFKNEFQAYPEIIREMITFFASNDCLEKLKNPGKHGFNDVLRGKQLTSDEKGNFRISLNGVTLPWQKTPALAQWTYLNSKHANINTWKTPLIKQERYAEKRKLWDQPFDVSAWLDWLAAINVQQGVAAVHRQSDDYHSLNSTDQRDVDLVMSAMKLVRKAVVQHLNANGVDISIDSNQEALNQRTAMIAQVRLSKARKHLEALPGDFRSKIFGYFRQFG